VINFLDPKVLADWLIHNVFNNMDKTTRREWTVTIFVIAVGFIGWMRAERRNR
jgi:hypothetical protein